MHVRMWRKSRVHWGKSNRKRLLITLAVGLVALIVVAVAWADSTVYFVGSADGSCAQVVQPSSDQIDNGFSNNYEVGGGTFQSQCTIVTVAGHLEVYAQFNGGALACDASGFNFISCPAHYNYTRAHCVNLSTSSSRWMKCYKIKQ